MAASVPGELRTERSGIDVGTLILSGKQAGLAATTIHTRLGDLAAEGRHVVIDLRDTGELHSSVRDAMMVGACELEARGRRIVLYLDAGSETYGLLEDVGLLDRFLHCFGGDGDPAYLARNGRPPPGPTAPAGFNGGTGRPGRLRLGNPARQLTLDASRQA